ncbi:MAG: hypothetical protein DMG22_06215 [Acidobacteria bacterium]|nr:MAG: hypothetical protein DMG22_06215 [Acidobacteriota bacterium]
MLCFAQHDISARFSPASWAVVSGCDMIQAEPIGANGNFGSIAQGGKPREATDLRPTELSFDGGARLAVGEE